MNKSLKKAAENGSLFRLLLWLWKGHDFIWKRGQDKKPLSFLQLSKSAFFITFLGTACQAHEKDDKESALTRMRKAIEESKLYSAPCVLEEVNEKGFLCRNLLRLRKVQNIRPRSLPEKPLPPFAFLIDFLAWRKLAWPSCENRHESLMVGCDEVIVSVRFCRLATSTLQGLLLSNYKLFTGQFKSSCFQWEINIQPTTCTY